MREFVRVHHAILGNLDTLVAVDDSGTVTTHTSAASIPTQQKNYEFYFPILELGPKSAGKPIGMRYERDGKGRLLPSLVVDYESGERANLLVAKNGIGMIERENPNGFTSDPALGGRDARGIHTQRIIETPETVESKNGITTYHFLEGENKYSLIIGTTPKRAAWYFGESDKRQDRIGARHVKNALRHGTGPAKKKLGGSLKQVLPKSGDYISDSWALGELLFYNKKFGSITPSAIFDVQSHKKSPEGVYLNSAGYGGMEWVRDATEIVNDLSADKRYDCIVEKFFKHTGEIVERFVEGKGRFPQRVRIDGAPTSEWGEQLDQPGQLLSSMKNYADELEGRGKSGKAKHFAKKNAHTIRTVADYLSKKVNDAGGRLPECMDPFERDWDTHSTTGCAIYSGLKAASKLTGDKKYEAAATTLKPELLSFWDDTREQFVRRKGDHNVDALTCWYSDVLNLDNPKEYQMLLKNTEKIEKVLGRPDKEGRMGIVSIENSNYIGDNVWPWMTGIVGQTYCKLARHARDKTQTEYFLSRAESMLEYTRAHTALSGMLGEQVEPKSEKTIWASPLAASMSSARMLEREIKTLRS